RCDPPGLHQLERARKPPRAAKSTAAANIDGKRRQRQPSCVRNRVAKTAGLRQETGSPRDKIRR
ncbi:MAG: hypothetical protein E6833_36755, partial [Bradyrhizobium sp.]|nr:hypothetical protein [Bradyrhizobium sp.]